VLQCRLRGSAQLLLDEIVVQTLFVQDGAADHADQDQR
jgi:hypothetical protein